MGDKQPDGTKMVLQYRHDDGEHHFPKTIWEAWLTTVASETDDSYSCPNQAHEDMFSP